MMETMDQFFSNEIYFIDKPIKHFRWFMIKKNHHAYFFYDPQAITAENRKIFHFSGEQTEMNEFLNKWYQSISNKGDKNDKQTP